LSANITGGIISGLANPIGISDGGTNGSTSPVAGAIAYGTGTAYAFTAAGTSGQFLKSNGTSAPSWATIASGGVAWTAKTTTYTAVAGDYISAGTSSGAWTLTLPTSPATSSTVWIIDNANSWSINNLTVAPGGANTIQGVAQNLICNVSNRIVILIYNGTTWQINV
jgi:hypothetical protein